MTSVTLATAKLKVLQDLDMEDEVFVQDAEIINYFNDAIREAEAEILGIFEDYFLTSAALPLVQGTATYALPTGIYAHKIRGIVYNDAGAGNTGNRIYPIKRIRSSNKFFMRELLLQNPSSTETYSYFITNSASAGVKLNFVPAAQETSSANVIIWYLRTANVVAIDADVIDIPEFISFIYAFVKRECLRKEGGGMAPESAIAEVERQRKLMVETLTNMVQDDDNEIEKDLSHYDDSI